MKTKIVAALLAALTLGTVGFGSTSQAQAHHWRGWGWGGVGLGLALGTAAAATYAYTDCYWVRHFDRYGNDLGRVRVCS